MGRRPKNELASLARAARSQLALAEELGRSLKERVKMKKEASEQWTPDEDWRRDFASVTNTLQHAGNAMIRAGEANKKNLGGLTEEQLQAQFDAEIITSAQNISDEDWNRMVEARMKAKRP